MCIFSGLPANDTVKIREFYQKFKESVKSNWEELNSFMESKSKKELHVFIQQLSNESIS